MNFGKNKLRHFAYVVATGIAVGVANYPLVSAQEFQGDNNDPTMGCQTGDLASCLGKDPAEMTEEERRAAIDQFLPNPEPNDMAGAGVGCVIAGAEDSAYYQAAAGYDYAASQSSSVPAAPKTWAQEQMDYIHDTKKGCSMPEDPAITGNTDLIGTLPCKILFGYGDAGGPNPGPTDVPAPTHSMDPREFNISVTDDVYKKHLLGDLGANDPAIANFDAQTSEGEFKRWAFSLGKAVHKQLVLSTWMNYVLKKRFNYADGVSHKPLEGTVCIQRSGEGVDGQWNVVNAPCGQPCRFTLKELDDKWEVKIVGGAAGQTCRLEDAWFKGQYILGKYFFWRGVMRDFIRFGAIQLSDFDGVKACGPLAVDITRSTAKLKIAITQLARVYEQNAFAPGPDGVPGTPDDVPQPGQNFDWLNALRCDASEAAAGGPAATTGACELAMARRKLQSMWFKLLMCEVNARTQKDFLLYDPSQMIVRYFDRATVREDVEDAMNSCDDVSCAQNKLNEKYAKIVGYAANTQTTGERDLAGWAPSIPVIGWGLSCVVGGAYGAGAYIATGVASMLNCAGQWGLTEWGAASAHGAGAVVGGIVGGAFGGPVGAVGGAIAGGGAEGLALGCAAGASWAYEGSNAGPGGPTQEDRENYGLSTRDNSQYTTEGHSFFNPLTRKHYEENFRYQAFKKTDSQELITNPVKTINASELNRLLDSMGTDGGTGGEGPLGPVEPTSQTQTEPTDADRAVAGLGLLPVFGLIRPRRRMFSRLKPLLSALGAIALLAVSQGCGKSIPEMCEVHCSGPRFACERQCYCDCGEAAGHNIGNEADDPKCPMISSLDEAQMGEAGQGSESLNENIDNFFSQMPSARGEKFAAAGGDNPGGGVDVDGDGDFDDQDRALLGESFNAEAALRGGGDPTRTGSGAARGRAGGGAAGAGAGGGAGQTGGGAASFAVRAGLGGGGGAGAGSDTSAPGERSLAQDIAAMGAPGPAFDSGGSGGGRGGYGNYYGGVGDVSDGGVTNFDAHLAKIERKTSLFDIVSKRYETWSKDLPAR